MEVAASTHVLQRKVLIINNLVASTLWHRLKCLESPAGLSKVQAVILNFFWDKLHWVPQSVLYLPKEEGGRGQFIWGQSGGFQAAVCPALPLGDK